MLNAIFVNLTLAIVTIVNQSELAILNNDTNALSDDIINFA